MSSLFRVLAWLLVIGGAISAIVYYAYADVWVVPTDDPRALAAMEPTLRGGDLLLVERHGVPSLGNLVRCTDPDEPQRWVVGRIVAVGGTALKLTGQGFTIPNSRENSDSACDGQRLVNPASGDEVYLNCRNQEFAGMTYRTLRRPTDNQSVDSPVEHPVPLGKSFLLSDNRYLHLDSREFGSVPEDSCRHIVFRLWGGAGFTDGSRRFNIIW